VVTEFADRRMQEGEGRKDAYRDAAKRMAWPITASTATTLAAFAPLLFWPDVTGEFMKFLPLTLIATNTRWECYANIKKERLDGRSFHFSILL